jgi:tRNA(Ile)-lysidine synthase
MNTVFPKFREHIETQGLIHSGDTIIAGFSGGKDSVFLVLLLEELRKFLPFRLMAAYFNHRLRSDSQAEELWVTEFCRSRGIELQIGGRDVKRFKEENRLNLEHAASLSRYDFFSRLGRSRPGAKIATAHTRSDLAETFLIKLFRGSGLQGLSALYQNKEKRIIRPLLIFTQEEVADFHSRNLVEYYQDCTNRNPDFLRNRIRLQLMPWIEKIEPEIQQRIFRTVSILQEEFDYFRSQARLILEQELILGRILPLPALTALHLALQRHVAREYLRHVKGDLLGVGLNHIDAILDPSPKRQCLSLPGITLRREKGFLYPQGMTVPDYSIAIPDKGSFSIDGICRTVTVRTAGEFHNPGSNREIVVPESAIRFPLTARSPRREDQYQKIHAPYEQKVFEMIRVTGFPAALRNLCPVLVNGDGRIIWVWGAPVADPFRVRQKDTTPFCRIGIL